MKPQPLVEVFGCPVIDTTHETRRTQRAKLCPFNNRVPSCTKDKIDDPLGVCSVRLNERAVIICPVRFREGWLIATDAAKFFFPPNTNWTTLTEVRLNDRNGVTAGNIDVVCVSYDRHGTVTGYGALEVQTTSFQGVTGALAEGTIMRRARLLALWGRKTAIAVDSVGAANLPIGHSTTKERADIAWIVYDLVGRKGSRPLLLRKKRIIYDVVGIGQRGLGSEKAEPEECFLRRLQESGEAIA